MGEKSKICPLILSGNVSALYLAGCKQNDCAWWDAENAKCAILAIAETEAAAANG